MILLLCLFVLLASLNLNFGEQRSQNGTKYNKNESSHEIVFITYFGDRHRLNEIFLPTIRRFVNPLNFSVMAVLDDESSKDHILGLDIESSFGFKVRYNTPDLLLLSNRRHFIQTKDLIV